MNRGDANVTLRKGARIMSLAELPFDILFVISSYLRATDLSALQQTCRSFNDKTMISAIIRHFSSDIYGPELTAGFDSPIIAGDSKKPAEPDELYTSYEPLRNMEMLVVARVISRPEPPLMERAEGSFYVSKAWCRAALRWLQVQADERREREIKRMQRAEEMTRAAAAAAAARGNGKNQHVHNRSHSSATKMLLRSKKEQRIRNRKLSDALAPWPNVNADITCPHHNLINDVSRSRRRLIDKEAWRVLKKLYPESADLNCIHNSECIQCKLDQETIRKNDDMIKQKITEERKRPLQCPLVRAVFHRTGGVPRHKLVGTQQQEQIQETPTPQLLFSNGNICPLLPGIYHALPREWCSKWRKYIKTGDGGRPAAPDSSACLCDAHMLPLIPPHLEQYLYGDVSALLGRNALFHNDDISTNLSSGPISPTTTLYYPVGYNPIQQSQPPNQVDHASLNQSIEILRASGLSDVEIEAQRIAMLDLENQQRRRNQDELLRARERQRVTGMNNESPEALRDAINAELDRRNYIVVEILTDEEFLALEHWWPGIHSSYALKFAIVQIDSNGVEIIWTTQPCCECDSSGLHHRARMMIRSSCKGRIIPGKK